MREMAFHIPEVDIQRLALGRLPTAESLRVQRHLVKCASCLHRLIEIEAEFARQKLITGAPPPILESGKSLFIVHDTADGLIYSRAEERGNTWLARHWGKYLDGARGCKTLQEANEFLICSFAEMFPEHRCTDRCRIDPLDVEEP